MVSPPLGGQLGAGKLGLAAVAVVKVAPPRRQGGCESSNKPCISCPADAAVFGGGIINPYVRPFVAGSAGNKVERAPGTTLCSLY